MILWVPKSAKRSETSCVTWPKRPMYADCSGQVPTLARAKSFIWKSMMVLQHMYANEQVWWWWEGEKHASMHICVPDNLGKG